MHRKRAFKMLIKMQTILLLMMVYLALMGTNSYAQNYTEGIPPEVFETIQNALPNDGDVFPGYNWEQHHLTIDKEVNPGNDYYSVHWHGENPRGYYREGKRYEHDAQISCGIYALYGDVAGDLGHYYEFSVPNSQKWNALPGAYKIYEILSDASSYCRILFWNLDGSIRVDLWVGGNSDIVCPEAERLAKLVYSRLPQKFYSLKSDKDFTVPGFNQSSTSAGLTAEQPGSDSSAPTGPALTGPDSEAPISDAALPLAVGAAALVTALGTLGLAYSGGTTPAEAFGELKALLTPNREEAQSLPQDQPADGRDPQEILSDPRLHDQVTDVNGKKWVYYRRPGDLAGVGWTSIEAYNQTKAMEKENKIWTDRYGWQTKQELYNSEQMAEKFAADNRQATVKFNEELKAQPTPPPAELPLAELPSYISGQERERFAVAVKEATQEFEQETDDILKELVASEKRHKESVARSDKLGQEIELEGKKATFALQLAEDTQKLRKDGYWIRNPNNSYALQIKNRLFSPLDPKGVQCGDLVKLKLEEVKKLAAEKFGEGVLVDMVEIEERTTKAPQGILDYLDSAVPYNHKAIRVITPDGESFIVDYWQALHAKGSTSGLMQPENNFTEGWNKSLSGDIVIEGNLQVYKAEQNKLPELIKEHGQQEGLNLWHKQTNTVIQKAALPPDQKEAQLRKVQTLVNYLGVEGKKIGY